MKDKIMFKNYMTLLGEIFDKTISGALSDAYWIVLKKYDDHECEGAFKKAMAKCKFFPKPAELAEFARPYEDNFYKRLDFQHRAEAQWRIVLNAVRSRGVAKGKPVFEDPITEMLVSNQYSWSRLCETKESETHFEESRWKETFYNECESTERHKNHLVSNGGNPEEILKLTETIGNV